jgi:hypothetical protein
LTAVVDLDVVDRLLGAPLEYPPWRVADMAIRKEIHASWLSSMEARGFELGANARAHLQRYRRRVETLRRIGTDMADAYGATILKGEQVARYFPAPLHRQSNDVDLVVTDEESVWRCALALAERHGAVPHGVSVLEAGDSTHLGVTMKWPAEEPFLDKPMSADITTCAFAGDLRGVPIRVEPVAEDDLCGLFAVVEERFQHRFRLKDMLDLLILADVLERRLGDGLVETLCEHARRLMLAPELRQLITRTNEWVPLSERWQESIAALRPLARAEKALRRPDRPGMHRLRLGFPVSPHVSGDLSLTIHRRATGDMIITPLGTCLLLDGPVLDEVTLSEAVDFARTLATAR